MPEPSPNLITQPSIIIRGDLTRWVRKDFFESEFKKAWKEECLREALEKKTEELYPKDECKQAAEDLNTI
jgi:hypothetical protein